MDSLLFAGGLTTFGLGAAMTVFAWTVMRRNRRRETARAALLSGLAFPGGMPVDAVDDALPDTGGMFSADQFRRGPSLDSGTSLDLGTLFSEPEKSGAASRRTMALAAVGLLMTTVAGTYWWFASSSTSATSEPAPLASTTTVAVTPPPAAPARIELLALNHAATRAAFVVTGRIRNPVDATPLHDVVAVVYLVDGAGRVLMTVRAPLKRPVLNGGESSEFAAPASRATNVARYRVEFHAKERESLPQIDLRSGT